MSPKEPADDRARLLKEITHLRTELTASEAEIPRLNALVDQDMLLPTFNRRTFEHKLVRIWSSAERYEFQIALIYLDLDGMKAVNDQYGHDIGDKALKAVAEVLVHNSRDSDTVGRFLGGDEFALIMMHASEIERQKKPHSCLKQYQSSRSRHTANRSRSPHLMVFAGAMKRRPVLR